MFVLWVFLLLFFDLLYERAAKSHTKCTKVQINGESPAQFEDQIKVRKRVKIRNRYNQAPHLTQDTNENVTTLQLDITNESQEVSPFPPGDHKALINRRAQKHNKYKTEIT